MAKGQRIHKRHIPKVDAPPVIDKGRLAVDSLLEWLQQQGAIVDTSKKDKRRDSAVYIVESIATEQTWAFEVDRVQTRVLVEQGIMSHDLNISYPTFTRAGYVAVQLARRLIDEQRKRRNAENETDKLRRQCERLLLEVAELRKKGIAA